MAGNTIKIDQLSKAVEKELTIYCDEVAGAIKKLTTKVTRETVKELKQTSPVNPKSGRSPRYRDQWTSAQLETTCRKQINVVHNKDYRIPHLVEKGHALKNGGRTRAQPHIAPAEESAIKKIEDGTEKVIKSGGY